MPLQPMMTKKRFVDTAGPITVAVPGVEEPAVLSPYCGLSGCGWKGSLPTIMAVDGQNQKVSIRVAVVCTGSKDWEYS